MRLTGVTASIAGALTTGRNSYEQTHLQLTADALAAVLGILLIGLTIFLCYRFSDKLEQLLGPSGTGIVIRLSAFILVCIGIQIMFNGLEDFYHVLTAVAK